MTREDYLKFKWQAYPESPSEVLYSGRLQSIRKNANSITFQTEKNQIATEFQSKDMSWIEILRPGDLIAMDGQGKILLLAPGEPLAAKIPLSTLKLWSQFLGLIRQYFFEKEFLEISTPTLVTCPGTEPSLEAFSSELRSGSKTKKLFLPTSPELHLKKALCMGFENIFEIKSCFRNGEFSPHHQPEFAMLEWYRSYKNLDSIQFDFRDLIYFLASRLPEPNIFVPQNEQTVSVAELFQQYAGVRIHPNSTLEDYRNIAVNLDLKARGLETIDDYFFAIFLEKIEPRFNPTHLVFVKDYPPFQSALARLTPEGWADRMEVYFGGLELANGFNELNDPVEQEKRFIKDLDSRKKNGRSDIGLDVEFMDFLRRGMPPSSGIALGLDRLFMALFQISDIRDIRLFPYYF